MKFGGAFILRQGYNGGESKAPTKIGKRDYLLFSQKHGDDEKKKRKKDVNIYEFGSRRRGVPC